MKIKNKNFQFNFLIYLKTILGATPCGKALIRNTWPIVLLHFNSKSIFMTGFHDRSRIAMFGAFDKDNNP